MMKIVFDSYGPLECIPVGTYLRNKRLAKFFNRETAAAVVAAHKLLDGTEFDSMTPFFYDTGLLAFEDYGLADLVEASRDENHNFSSYCFTTTGLNAVSPLNQFKVLQNMPLSFVAIENNIHGDNAVCYGSASALLSHVMYSPHQEFFLIGAGKTRKDGSVESGFALLSKAEIEPFHLANLNCEGIEFFRDMYRSLDVNKMESDKPDE